MLAGILRRCAAAAKRPPARAVTWTDRVQQRLAQSLTDGPPSLATVAHDLAVSPRTLQRRLAESGTSWRHELDLARQAHFEQAAAERPGDLNALAHEIGFSDFRALRRARHRWTSST
jgi:AraC-like DNA-binding protein